MPSEYALFCRRLCSGQIFMYLGRAFMCPGRAYICPGRAFMCSGRVFTVTGKCCSGFSDSIFSCLFGKSE